MKYKNVLLRDIAFEDKLIILPNSPEAKTRPYLGLEQIESQSGKITDYENLSVDWKSNTFAFDESHVLYGKLRPYLNKVAVPVQKGRCSTEIIPILPKSIDREFLAFLLRSEQVVSAAMREKTGSRMPRANMSAFFGLQVRIPEFEDDQRRIAARLKAQLAEVEKARSAAEVQLAELIKLGDAIIFDSLKKGELSSCLLGDVLIEVKKGIGESWEDYPVLGATRTGIAPAKEPPGKYPHKYKPIVPGTIFYNPMRILIGSIAFLDVGMKSGITSPDYVVLQGKEGVVDSRWFYYWLRSPLGEQCITSLARGAVRERMLFSRLAEGNIDLPDYKTQQLASSALAELNPMRTSIERQLTEINLLPQKILSEAFGSDPTVTK